MVSKRIHPAILKEFPDLNDQQKEAISITSGPLLIIAGPGSGKTYVLVLRTLNLLLNNLAQPNEIVLCTFTEKAAFELRDRLSVYAQKLNYNGDIHEIHVGTIHGISNDYILKNRHFTKLGNNYDVLDDLTQKLFIFDHFGQIIKEKEPPYLRRWATKWTTIDGVVNYFNKMTEELLDVEKIISDDPIIKEISEAFSKYEKCLIDYNKVDFAHIQKLFLELLDNREIGNKLISKIKYILVDEYQDTNYVQEQLLMKLASKNMNLCVVGDEDQSLYRFRGATVRNILEFDNHFKNCSKIKLTINYRSHKKIIDGYNKFMAAWDWVSEDKTKKYRFDKIILPNPKTEFPEYPAIFAIGGETKEDEAEKFADYVLFLKENKIIEDYSQIALLLYSVRSERSGAYIQALKSKNIPAFCPRQRAFFENVEIKHIVGCLTYILGHYGESREDMNGPSLVDLARYLDEQVEDLKIQFDHNQVLLLELKKAVDEHRSIKEGGTLDKRLADYLYSLLAVEPFKSYMKDENKARNLATFSQLLTTFQTYYHYTVITTKNLTPLRRHFFNSFLRLLYEGGINEYEDPDMPFPKGYVQIMTIHQSKGLEFPIVVVGALDKGSRTQKNVDNVLGPFYHRPVFEPEDKITGFDRMRLHYVAFSRAEKMLVLTNSIKLMDYFKPIYDDLPQWPDVDKESLKKLSFKLKNRLTPKKSYSFTSDLSIYETCPRQYLFFNELEFTPSRSAEAFFGSLIHQTIEEIHKNVLSGKLNLLTVTKIRDIFEFNFKQLVNSGMRPLGQSQKELAFKQIMNYFNQNKPEMKKVIETEVDVSVEQGRYILTGKIDLLMGDNKKLEILDFKSQKRPIENKELIRTYHKQLCIYGHIIEKRYKKKPDKLTIYWTSEDKKENARMSFVYDPSMVKSAVQEFDEVVKKIQNQEFNVIKIPERKYCAECDIRSYCVSEGTVKLSEIGSGFKQRFRKFKR